jgi:hypothetical protein
MRAWIGLLLLAVSLGGCSFAEDTDRGERAVARFHLLFGASQYAEIYADTTESFREAATEAEFVEFMSAVRRKLGNVRACERTGLEVNWDGDATSIWLSYETAYEVGIATEQFVWVLDGEKTRLDGYQIDSKVLILR